MIVREANANGIWTPVLDEAVGSGNTLDDGAGISRHLLRGEAKTRGDGGVDAESGRGATDRVFDTVEHVDNTGLFFDCGCDLIADLSEYSGIVVEEFDLYWLRRVREVVDHVLQDLGKLHVELRLF